VDGWLHGTFHEACLARGLLSSDANHFNAFQEMVHNTVSASSVRQQFVDFLLNVQVAEPVRLFEAFVDHMIDGEYSALSVQMALSSIDRELRTRASSIVAFGFDPVPVDAENYNDDVANDCSEEFATLYDQCTDEQRNALYWWLRLAYLLFKVELERAKLCSSIV